ncbi:MAG TPA: cysteine--tRNA ligase [Candidatus Bilamarchaeaceae archaeon]|nr:cysteine--tRNA ligase [Candidatus Bilamarchaeaceae archaeon]
MLIFNTPTRKKEDFRFPEGSRLNIYVCGLTPYDHAHVGHARTYVAFDTIKRHLVRKGADVFHIQNITDVEDKVFNRSRETGIPPVELAERFQGEALGLFDSLNILRANVYPKVSEHVPEIISMIRAIMQNGLAYETETGVYFSVRKFRAYGKLSGQKMDEIKRGARIEPDETKEDPADFALWKKGGDVLTFDSPWGVGRPGWHIECSAMADKYTGGKPLDIHGGARDLIFPHHENEIAQAEGATGHPFTRFWMHTGFLTVDGEKMSKSLGNFITLKDLLSRHSPNSVRLFFLRSHYRSPVDYSEESIRSAEESVKRIFNLQKRLDEALASESPATPDAAFRASSKSEISSFHSCMDDDFDTPGAISHLFNLISLTFTHLEKEKLDTEQLAEVRGQLEHMLWVLGLEKEEFEMPEMTEKLVSLLIDLREKARKEKNYGMSDEIRRRLGELGVVLEDSDKGVKWRLEKK